MEDFQNTVLTTDDEQANLGKTLRPVERLPPLPNDSEALKSIPKFNLVKSEVINGELIFKQSDDFEKALSDGFFLVKIPVEIDLSEGDRFCENFFKPRDDGEFDAYKGYKEIKVPGEYQGYFDREFDQWENFYIEKANWDPILPYGVRKLGHQMAEFGLDILRSVLKKIGIPKSDWDIVTNGLTNKCGHQMLAFNHFRPEKNTRGTKFHRDSGWVTVLRSSQPGLVAYINNNLYAINPEPGYFIINFGSSIEVLTAKLDMPVRGNIHGVVRTIKNSSNLKDRFSYVVFLDSDLEGLVYRYENGKPIEIQTMKDFAIQEVSRTYDDGGSL